MSILVSILDEVDPSYTVIIRRLHSFFRGLDTRTSTWLLLFLDFLICELFGTKSSRKAEKKRNLNFSFRFRCLIRTLKMPDYYHILQHSFAPPLRQKRLYHLYAQIIFGFCFKPFNYFCHCISAPEDF